MALPSNYPLKATGTRGFTTVVRLLAWGATATNLGYSALALKYSCLYYIYTLLSP